MAKIWTTTVPNPFNDTNSNKSDNISHNSSSNASELNAAAAAMMLLTAATPSTTTNTSPSNRSTTMTMMDEKEKIDFEISNQEYNEFWRKLKGYANVTEPTSRLVKSVPDVTFSWEGVSAFCQKKRSIWKSCWNGITRRGGGGEGRSKQASRDQEAIIGKWDPSRNGAASNDSYFNMNDNKVMAISYRNSSSSTSSSSSSSSSSSNSAEDLESFSSATSSNLSSKPNFFQVLNNVNGYLKAGECLAIMGASGSGKTTLLNVLNFRQFNNFKVTSSIKLNGKKISERELVSISAYVLQDDLFIPTLTPKEHLIFLAMVKMDPKLSKQDKLNRVEEILDEFNLVKCQNTKIGGVNDSKGISGGEKRRLAFASEILTDPLILFCDEPTSGLDSHMALMIVNTLSKLAKKGKIIISTIHQPSSQVFDKFQKLCLLAEGRVAYFGDREQAFDFFKSISYECPLKYNPADYYIEILAAKVNKKSNLEKIKDICDTFERSSFHQNTLKEFRDIDERYRKFDKEIIIGNAGNIGKRFQCSYLNQFIWLFWRQLLNMLREPLATRILVAQSIIIGIFLGFTYFRLNFDQKGIQNRNGLLFMVLLQICITYLFGVASVIHEQWAVTKRDVKNGVYSIVLYYIAKTLSELPKNVVCPMFTVSIVFWMANVNPNFVTYVTIMAILVFAGNTSVGFGSFLAVVAPNLDATLGLIGPTFFPLLIFSGFLINSTSIPSYFVWIKYISWMFYANEAMMIALWSNVNTISCPPADGLTPDSCILNGKEVLKMLSMNEENFVFDMSLLVSMTVFWFVLSGLMIYIKSKF